jgi:hypothetical protein
VVAVSILLRDGDPDWIADNKDELGHTAAQLEQQYIVSSMKCIFEHTEI